MFVHPEFDPVALSIGPISVRWYGLMYLFAFGAGGLLAAYRARQPHSGWNAEEISDFVFYMALVVILGGRLGYALFYNFAYYSQHPIEILYVWTGGMSFHGGLLGVIIALWIYAKNTSRHFLTVCDFIAPLCGLGIAAVRFANFLNQELWGRVTDFPYAMVFPIAGPEPRHASQLYEMVFEGLFVFLVIWIYTRKKRPLGRPASLFLILYGLARFSIEFVREPDAHLGVVALDWMTMGQILSLPMIVLGCILFLWAGKTQGPHKTA
ncbi:MAG: prolipoprotein diacylglyceryl transferase [Methylococcales bacterium]|nr:prolipoprotein diacylglyceryl transferase [Methylococcales bacterium]